MEPLLQEVVDIGRMDKVAEPGRSPRSPGGKPNPRGGWRHSSFRTLEQGNYEAVSELVAWHIDFPAMLQTPRGVSLMNFDKENF